VTAKPKPLALTSRRSTTPGCRTSAARWTKTCARSKPPSTSRSAAAARTAGSTATLSQARLAAAALQHFYEQASEPLSIDELQLGLIEISRNRMRTLHAHPPCRVPA
jgi:hypothetical protein